MVHAGYRLKRNWPHFKRSGPKGSSTCWNVRTEKLALLTQKVEASALEALGLWTSPKKTTDESGSTRKGQHIRALLISTLTVCHIHGDKTR